MPSPEISPVGRILAPRSAISGVLVSVNAAIVASERARAVEIVEIKSKNSQASTVTNCKPSIISKQPYIQMQDLNLERAGEFFGLTRKFRSLGEFWRPDRLFQMCS